MKPRKFYYEEMAYFGESVLIEWTDRGLELQKSTSCIPFLLESDICLHPSDEDWNCFVQDVKALDLHPSSPVDFVCDGSEVNCHITFRTTLIKFSIINPEFHGFEKFRALVNSMTVCEEFPDGIFFDELEQ